MKPIYVYIDEYSSPDGLRQYPIDFSREPIPTLKGSSLYSVYSISSLVCLCAALLEYSVPNPDYFIKALMKEAGNE